MMLSLLLDRVVASAVTSEDVLSTIYEHVKYDENAHFDKAGDLYITMRNPETKERTKFRVTVEPVPFYQ